MKSKARQNYSFSIYRARMPCLAARMAGNVFLQLDINTPAKNRVQLENKETNNTE